VGSNDWQMLRHLYLSISDLNCIVKPSAKSRVPALHSIKWLGSAKPVF
jgi:hypothetical protein